MNRSYIRLSFSLVLAFLFLGFFVFVSLRFLFFLFLFFFFFLFFLFLLFFFFFFFFFPPYPVLMPFLRRLLPIVEKKQQSDSLSRTHSRCYKYCWSASFMVHALECKELSNKVVLRNMIPSTSVQIHSFYLDRFLKQLLLIFCCRLH